MAFTPDVLAVLEENGFTVEDVRRAMAAKERRSRNKFGRIEGSNPPYRALYRYKGKEYCAPTRFPSRTAAQLWLNSEQKKLSDGTWAPPTKMTVQELAERWAKVKVKKEEATKVREASLLRNHVYPFIGDKLITFVTTGDIESMVAAWITKGQSPETIARQHSTVTALFNYGRKAKLLRGENPSEGVELPEKVSTPRHMFTPKNIQDLQMAVGEKYGLSVLLGHCFSLRWNEIFALKVGDIDLDANLLRVSGGLTRKSAGVTVPSDTSNAKHKKRIIHMDDDGSLAELLQAHMGKLADRSPDAWLFPNADGGHMAYNNFRIRFWLPALDKAGLGDITPRPGTHDLKRVSATVQVAQGVDGKVLENRAGGLGFDVYAKVDPASDRRATSALLAWARQKEDA